MRLEELSEGYRQAAIPLREKLRLLRQAQLRRMERVIRDELTDLQREVLLAVYYGGKSQAEIAADRGVNRSTVCRTLHRAEQRLRRFLRY